MPRSLVFALFFIGVLSGAVSGADAVMMPGEIPPDLVPWQAWVLHGQEDALCPGQYNDGAAVRCQWPSRLQLDLSAEGGRFEQHWLMFAEGWAALPGGREQWPESVAVDGRSVAVILRDNAPAVRLTAGEHRIMGRFTWSRLPETLPIPPALGLFSLVIDGREVRSPMLDDQGRLWLLAGQTPEDRAPAFQVKVFRLLDDTIPMQVHTLLRLDVSGQAREIELDSVLIPNSTPMALDSSLPARIREDGRLIIQARAGNWAIRIITRQSGPQHKINAGSTPHGEEVWSFQPHHELRMVEILDAPPVEPAQTEMPIEWRRFQAFSMKSDSTVTLKEIRRGDPDPAPDQLALQRTWWLDFDGGGFTVHDDIAGTLSRRWSLAMNPPMLLGRVATDGQERVITEQGPEKKWGIELRRGRLDLQADARLPQRAGAVSVVNWDHDFQSVNGMLHLPPGWRLLATAGVDQVSDSWMQRWSLLDFFLVLIIALAVYKLRSWPWGVLALAVMVLIFQEPGAPRLVWLHLLAVLALLPMLPAGIFRRLVGLWGIGAFVVLLATAVPFGVQQLRWGFYPQLAPQQHHYPIPLPAVQRPYTDAAPLASAPEPMPDRRMMKAPSKTSRESAAAQVFPEKERRMRQQDPEALIPTGPGLPDWRWQSVDLGWSGPVAKEQTLRLYLLSPLVNLLLALLRVGLLTLLIWSLVDWRPWWEQLRKKYSLGAVLLIAALSPALTSPGRAAAEPSAFPPPAILDELRRRLLEKPDCLPHCADISRMELVASGDAVQIMLKINCAERVAVPLPVHRKSWPPEQILLDNAPIGGLARDEDGQLWAMVPAGLHTLMLLGNAGQEAIIQIPMPLKPHLSSYSVQGWRVSGIHADGSVGSTLQLTRMQTDQEQDLDTKAQAGAPPFLQVERVLHLGLSWRTSTTVKRLTPTGTPIVAGIPLLAGESVTTPGVEVAQNQVLISLAPDQSTLTYSAELQMMPQIRLEAPRAVPWTETWTLDAGVIWHCDLEGIPIVHHQDGVGQWQPQWHPWPGEQVTIHVHRPDAVAGQTKTIDQAVLVQTPGQRFGQGELQLTIRTSRGGQHTVALPPASNLQQVMLDGRSLPVRQDGRFVTVPLQPGTQQVEVKWQQMAPFTNWFNISPVNIGQEAANARMTLHMPDQRWILLAGGPRWGPAVLFWSYLAAIVLAAVALGRLKCTPLATWQWLLLGLGLTQIPAFMALLIVGWLLVLGLRERQTMPTHWLPFNAVQIGIVLWTGVALFALFVAVEAGLLGHPEMQIAGNGSTYRVLHWTQDHVRDTLPQPWVFSLPVWVFRILMLAWSLWLALALLGWLKWGWHCLGRDGLWRKRVRRPSAGN